MRRSAWSPDSQLNDLVAVGTTTARVLRASAHACGSHHQSYARALVVLTGPTFALAVRNSRACNALALPPLQIPGETWGQSQVSSAYTSTKIPRAKES
ncbi:hypothetical protein APHAL10511_000501 [Amanita phalloides]|nr:hypothetical protein APHAL10511_000501 [Amanita phalloides]